jgi:hypothetical protein
MQLKLYKYLPGDDAGGRLADPLRRFLRANNLTGQEWKGRVNEHLVPRLHQLFQDSMRTWTPAPPPTRARFPPVPPGSAPTNAASAPPPPTTAFGPPSTPISDRTSSPSSAAAECPANEPIPRSTPAPLGTKWKRVQRVRLLVKEPHHSRTAELAAVQMHSATMPNAPRSTRRSRSAKFSN